MSRSIIVFTVTLLLLISLSSNSSAQLSIRPQEVTFSSVVGSGARAFGMGGAFIAIADDGSGASWNPAALAQLERPEALAVFSFNDFDTDFPSSVGFLDSGEPIEFSAQLTSQSGYNLDFLSMTYPIRIGNLKFVPQVGYQRVINLSLDPEYEEPFTATSEINIGGENFVFNGELDLEGDFSGGFDIISAGLAIQLSPKISLGSSFNIWLNGQKGMQITNTTVGVEPEIIPALVTVERAEIESDVSGFNVNLGFLLKPIEEFSIGFVFKSPFTLDFEESKRIFSDGELVDSLSFTQSSDFEYPLTVGFGVGFRPVDQLTLSFDFTFTKWSEGKLTNNEFVFLDGFQFTFNENIPFPGNGSDENGEFRKQNDTKQFRIGAEYVLLADKVLLPLRVGFFTNAPYITDGSDDSITYTGFTLGTGIGFGNFLFDIAFVSQSGTSFFSDESLDDRKFNAKQFYVSTIVRL